MTSKARDLFLFEVEGFRLRAKSRSLQAEAFVVMTTFLPIIVAVEIEP